MQGHTAQLTDKARAPTPRHLPISKINQESGATASHTLPYGHPRRPTKKRNVPPARDPSSAGGASINGIALDCTMDQRATRAAGATVTARPASAEGARRVAPAKDDTKPIMVAGGGEAGGRLGIGRRKGELD